MEIASLFTALGFKVDTKGAAQYEAALQRVGARAMAWSDQITRAAAGMTLAIGTVTAGLGAALGKSVVDVSAQFEGFETALTTIEGSSEKARASMDWIADFAKKTPYQLAGVTESFIKLRSYGLDATDGTLRMLGDTASAMNKPLDQAVEMFADAASFQFERMREFGITASQEDEKVTFQFTKDGKTVRETVAKTGEAVTSWVRNNLEGRFAGAMLRQSKTFSGMMSTLGDEWESFQLRIGRGGFFDKVKNGLADILDQIGEMDRNGTLDLWSKRLGFAFEWVLDKARNFAIRIGGHVETIMGLFEGKFGNIGENLEPITKALGLLLFRLFPVTGAFLALGLAIEDWLTYMAGGQSVIGDLIQSLADFLGTDPDKVATALGEIAKAAGWFAAASFGITLFAGALGRLTGALVLLRGMQWAVTFLSSLAGISWGAATAGAGAAAAGAGAAAGGGAATAGRAGGSAVAAAGAVRTFGPAAALGAAGGAILYYVDKIADGINTRIKEIGSSPKELEAWTRERTAPIANNGIGQSGHYNLSGSGAADFSAYEARVQGRGGDGTQAGINVMKSLYENAKSWWDSASAAASAASLAATINDSRDQSVTNNVSAPVTVNVQQAAQAPAAVGKAVGSAIGSAVTAPPRTVPNAIGGT